MLVVYIIQSFIAIPPHTPLGVGELCRDFMNAIATHSVQAGTCQKVFFLNLGGGFSQQKDTVITPIAG